MAKNPHPSGKPLRESKPKGHSIWRVPPDSYLTPRLNARRTDAIGFVHDFAETNSDIDRLKRVYRPV